MNSKAICSEYHDLSMTGVFCGMFRARKMLLSNSRTSAAISWTSDDPANVSNKSSECCSSIFYRPYAQPHTLNSTVDQCVTVAQLRTGHSPLLVAYLHRIGRRDSTNCVHCNGADEMAEHLVLHCPAHDQTRRESWPNLHYQSDPRRLWSFLERIEVVPHPRPGMRETETSHPTNSIKALT